MRTRSASDMVAAYQKLINRLNKSGIQPKMHILDNECSELLKTAITNNDMDYQLVPPHNHRRNLAERAIQTFKAHFISILCGVDDKFPVSLWCYILPQLFGEDPVRHQPTMVPLLAPIRIGQLGGQFL